MDLPEITEVKRLEIRPGDRLVVRLDREPDDAEFDHLCGRLRALLGDVPVVILGPDADLEVIGQADPAPAVVP